MIQYWSLSLLNDNCPVHKVIAIIPARSGSKRLKNKNILDFNKKPLLAWTIEAAKEAKVVDEVFVSTDCFKIKKVAEDYGALVPFMRSSDLSSDTASTDDAILSFINQLDLCEYDIIVILQPTSPLRNSTHIDEAIKLFKADGVEGVISVSECEHSPVLSNTLPEDLNMNNFIPREVASGRSQDFSTYYRLNGGVFAYRVGFFINHGGRVYDEYTKAYIMDQVYSCDIDTELDFKIAEFLQNYIEG